MATETIFKQQHPAYGYEVRTELVDNPEDGADRIEMQNAYTISGDYIGNPRIAKILCEERSIAPEKITPESGICQIGFCEREQKWYGWSHRSSHRAIQGFGVGSTATRSKIADRPTDDPEYEGLPYRKRPLRKRSSYPAEKDHEKWTAKTLDDARQMAIDFANSVA